LLSIANNIRDFDCGFLFFLFLLSRLVAIIIIYCITAVYTMACICVRIYTYNIWNVYGGRKGLSSSLLWHFRDGARGVWRCGVNAAAAWCGAAAARELVRVKDELCWYKSARF